jgi:hypothetical protein
VAQEDVEGVGQGSLLGSLFSLSAKRRPPGGGGDKPAPPFCAGKDALLPSNSLEHWAAAPNSPSRRIPVSRLLSHWKSRRTLFFPSHII